MNRAELYAGLDHYLAALARRDAAAVRWSASARISENNVMLPVGDGVWGTIDALGAYRLRFADPQTRSVGFFGTVHEYQEESAFTVRLRFAADGSVAESESIVVRQSDSGIKFENPRYWDKPLLKRRRTAFAACRDGAAVQRLL